MPRTGRRRSPTRSEAAEAALDAYAFNNAIAHLNEALEALPGRRRRRDALSPLGHARHGLRLLGPARRRDRRLQEALEHAGDGIARASGPVRDRRGVPPQGCLRRCASATSTSPCARWDSHARGACRAVCSTSGERPFFFHCSRRGSDFTGGGPDRERRIEIAFATYLSALPDQRPLEHPQYTHCSYKIAAFAKQSRKPELVAVGLFQVRASTCGMFSLDWLARVFVRRAQKAAESCRRADVQAMARAHVGTAHYFAGRLDEAEADLREAVGMLDKVGDWFGMFSHHFLRHVYAVRGDIPQELAEAEIEIAIGTARGDVETLAWGHYGKADALARAGRVDEALELAARSVESLTARRVDHRRRSPQASSASSVSRRPTTAGAATALERSRSSIIRDSSSSSRSSGPTFPLLVESLLGPRWADAEGGPSAGRGAGKPGARAALPASSAGVTRTITRTPCASADVPPSPSARRRQAARYLERAIAAAEKLGARYDLARALLDASLVIPDKADDYRRRGQQLLDELGAVVPEAERIPV